MTSVRRSLAFSFIEKYAVTAIGLVSYVVIARLLTPEEVGLYSAIAALAGMAQVLREFGVGNYLIQDRELTRDKVDAAGTMTLSIGLLLCIASWLGADAIAGFYGQQQLVNVIRVVSLNFLALPVCSVCLSLLRRDMNFKRLLFINLAAALLGFVVTLAAAFAGFGPVSLAAGVLACNLLTALLSWQAVAPAARPRFWRWTSAWRQVFEFGRAGTPAAVLSSLSSDINDLAVGRVLGFAPAALVSRALGLMNLFQRDLMQAARNVAYPAFAALHRADGDVEASFIKATAAVTAASFTYFGFMALFPLELLRLMAGPNWDAAAPLVPWFALAGLFASVATLGPSALLATGHFRMASRADIVVSFVRVGCLLIALFSWRSMEAVAASLSCGFVLATGLHLAAKARCMGADWPRTGRALGRSLMVALLTLAVPALVSLSAGWRRTQPLPMWAFLLTCLGTCVAWLLAVHYCRHPLGDEPAFRRLTGFLPKRA
jgi:lipopolysaccharide exporter